MEKPVAFMNLSPGQNTEHPEMRSLCIFITGSVNQFTTKRNLFLMFIGPRIIVIAEEITSQLMKHTAHKKT